MIAGGNLNDGRFLSPPSARRATPGLRGSAPVIQFLSPPSARRATYDVRDLLNFSKISIPALREEGDVFPRRFSAVIHDFYPRPPRGGRPQAPALQCAAASISIPALREEGDVQMLVIGFRRVDFYPRPPRGGRRIFVSAVPIALLFLSPPSARRATKAARVLQAERRISIPALREEGDGGALQRHTRQGYFYPRPPRGGRPGKQDLLKYSYGISIPALREEGDRWPSSGRGSSAQNFYPRPPRGGRRGCHQSRLRWHRISIPALREEGDLPRSSVLRWEKYFYPRPPRGGRRCVRRILFICPKFLSPPSARRATADLPPDHDHRTISIPALREEGDVRILNNFNNVELFLSPPSARRATNGTNTGPRCINLFLSPPSARRATTAYSP